MTYEFQKRTLRNMLNAKQSIFHCNQKLSDRPKRKHIFNVIGIILIFLCFFVAQYYTPYFGDDFSYNFCKIRDISGRYTSTDNLITSVKDWWDALVAHRFSMNGRISDLFVISTMYISGKTGFAIANSLMFLLLVTLISKRIFSYISFKSIFISTFLIFLILPDAKINIFWASGACNYLWGSVYYLFFIYCYDKKSQHKLYYHLCLISAFILSSNHECSGAAMTGACCLKIFADYLKNKKTPDKFTLFLLAVCISGFCITLMSPCVWNRMELNFVEGRFLNAVISIVQTFPALLIPSLIFIFALKHSKFKLLFDNFSFLFIVANLVIVCALITQIKPSACFYLCVGILVFCIDTFHSFIQNNKKQLFILSILTLGIISFPYYYSVFRASKFLKIAIEKAAFSDVIVFDTTDNPKLSEDFYLSSAIPYDFQERRQACLLWESRPFIILYNSLVDNRSVYKCFDDKDPSQVHVYTVNEKCYIRLPKNVVPKAYQKLSLISKDLTKKGITRPYLYGFSSNFLNKFLDSKIRGIEYLGVFSPDYDGKYHYIVLSQAPPEYFSLKLPVYLKDNNSNDILCIPLHSTCK